MEDSNSKINSQISQYSSFFFLNISKEKIKVNFYSFREDLVYKNEYPSNKYINDLKDDFLNKINRESLELNQNTNKDNLKFYVKEKDKFIKLKNDEKIQNIYKREKDKIIDSNKTSTNQEIILKIYVKEDNIYERLSDNMEKYIINNNYLIGRPILNQHKYYLYNKNLDNLSIVKYPKEQRKKHNLKSYSGINSYCNALNNLYIYEGNSDLNFITENNNFYKINLEKNDINIISFKFPNRILHSMIFIPESYIFIVGGKKVKDILIYIIEEKNRKYEKYLHPLPYEILEPSLIYINNKYLYAFENSSLDFHIIRTDLINVKPFEEIQIKNFNYDINQKFFGVGKYGNSILFLGGQMINLFNDSSTKCFIFNYEDETVERCNKEFKPFEFLEKNFIPLQEGVYFQLTEYKEDNKYIPKKVILVEDSENNQDLINHIKKDT